MLAFAMFLSSYPFRVGLRITADEARVSLALAKARAKGQSLRGGDSLGVEEKVLHVPAFPPQTLSLVDDDSLVSMDNTTRTMLAAAAAQVSTTAVLCVNST
jgi:hypothetical protein